MVDHQPNEYNSDLDYPACNETDSQIGYFAFTIEDHSTYQEWKRYYDQNGFQHPEFDQDRFDQSFKLVCRRN